MKPLILLAAAAVLTVAGCSAGSSTPAAARSASSPSRTPSPAAPTSVAPTSASSTAPEAGDLLTRMHASVVAATSVRIKGNLTTGGQTAVLDLALSTTGSAYGTVETSGIQVTVLQTGGKEYEIVTDAILKELKVDGPTAALMRGKYIPMDSATSKTLDPLLDMKTFMASIAGTSLQGIITGTTQIDGITATEITTVDGSKTYLAADGTSLPLRVAGTSQTPAELDFSGWNTDLKIPGAPSAAQIIDPSTFGS